MERIWEFVKARPVESFVALGACWGGYSLYSEYGPSHVHMMFLTPHVCHAQENFNLVILASLAELSRLVRRAETRNQQWVAIGLLAAIAMGSMAETFASICTAKHPLSTAIQALQRPCT